MVMLELDDFVIRNCRIGYKCERDWDDLTDNGTKNTRYCSDCKQSVVRCTTVKQLKKALALNQCVAIPEVVVVDKTHLVGHIDIEKLD